MLHFFKYLIYVCIFISLLLFYFLFTPLGTSQIYTYVGKKLSQKTDLNINIKSINMTGYPQVQLVMHIQNKAKLTLWGYLDDALVDMDYILTTDCIATEQCKIDDDIKIKGHIKGPFNKLKITGKGTALDGNVTYSAIKYTEKVENIHLQMRDINSSKLFNLLGQTALIEGKANADLTFTLMDTTHKQGHFTYEVYDKNFQGIPLHLQTNVEINDDMHTFTMDINSPDLKLNISKGHYNQVQKQADAFYTLDVKDLSKLETLLGYKYQGSFYAMGEMSYNKYIKITGLSKSLGGMLDFTFEKDKLDLDLNNVIFEDIMHLLSLPSLLSATTTGKITYHFMEKTLVANTALHHAYFKDSKLVHVIQKKSGIRMKEESFDNSKLELTYYENIINGNLKLTNAHSHVYLTSTMIDTNLSTINAYFDFKMQHQEFSGKVYGNLENPKVNLNMQKLVRYQMDKQVDKMIGKNGRKIMEKMPMGGVAKDMATDMGASFMKVFF